MKQETRTYENEKTVRVVTKDDGTIMYCLIDIAKCLGYKAPSKFATRYTLGEKLQVSWSNGIRHGKSWMVCVSMKEFLVLADRFTFPTEFVQWMQKNHEKPQNVKAQPADEHIIIDNDDMERSIEMMLDMLNNLTYACIDLKRELEKSRKRVVSFAK